MVCCFKVVELWLQKQLPDRWTMLVRWLVRSQSTHYLPEILTLPLRFPMLSGSVQSEHENCIIEHASITGMRYFIFLLIYAIIKVILFV